MTKGQREYKDENNILHTRPPEKKEKGKKKILQK